jgi:hypothetical protein
MEVWEERRVEVSLCVSLEVLPRWVIAKRGNLMVVNPLFENLLIDNFGVDVRCMVDQSFDVAAVRTPLPLHKLDVVTHISISTILRDFAADCIVQQGQGWGLV